MKLWANTLVKNEELYVWFAVTSVIDYVDKALLWDTGSSDNTFEILKLLKNRYPDKIVLEQVGEVDINDFTKIRQQMLEQTKSDWMIIADGDEVWWKDDLELLRTVITRNQNAETIVSRNYTLVGDIFHYQEENAGMYKIDSFKGHLNIRAMNRNIPGLHLERPHGTQGFFDENGVLIQDRDKGKRIHVEEPAYLHFTNLPRSGNRKDDLKVPKREQKLKYEIGNSFPLDFYYPEVFFVHRPEIVPCPWINMSEEFISKAKIQTPLRKLKRRMPYDKVGY